MITYGSLTIELGLKQDYLVSVSQTVKLGQPWEESLSTSEDFNGQI